MTKSHSDDCPVCGGAMVSVVVPRPGPRPVGKPKPEPKVYVHVPGHRGADCPVEELIPGRVYVRCFECCKWMGRGLGEGPWICYECSDERIQ